MIKVVTTYKKRYTYSWNMNILFSRFNKDVHLELFKITTVYILFIPIFIKYKLLTSNIENETNN